MARKSRRLSETLESGRQSENTRIYATAIYARLSVENSGKDDDGAALETQIAVCEEYVRTCPYLRQTDIYADNGRTGTVFDRPAFNRLMDDIRSGRITCIVVRDLSRFGRDYVETGTDLEHIFPQFGVRFISVKENYDSHATDGSNESLMIPLQNMINSLYSKDISRKVSASVRTQMENGSFRWRKIPYGYKWDESRSNIVPDERTAGYVRNIFQWKLEGLSVTAILDRLEEAHAPIPETLQRVNSMEGVNTMCWSASTIHGLLKNPAYCGDFMVGRTRKAIYAGMYERKRTGQDEWYVTRDAHKPIISREAFDRVQAIMKTASDARRAKMGQSREVRSTLVNLFEDKIFCADCGKRMYFHRKKIDKDKRNRWYAFYECSTAATRRTVTCTSHYIRQDTLEGKVLNAIKLHNQVALDYEVLIEKLQSTAREKNLRSQLNNAVKSVSMKLRGVSEKRSKLYDDYADGTLDEQEYIFAKAAYDKQWEQLNTQLDELTERRSTYVEVMSPNNRWIRMMKGIQTAERLSQELVDHAITQVLVHVNGDIELCFKYHDIFNLTKACIDRLTEGGESI